MARNGGGIPLSVVFPKKKVKVKGEIKKKNWTVPQVLEGGGVQLGGLERPGMCQPSSLEKETKISSSTAELRSAAVRC